MTIKLFFEAIFKLLLGVVLVGLLVFLPAGTLAYFNGWLFMVSLFCFMLCGVGWRYSDICRIYLLDGRLGYGDYRCGWHAVTRPDREIHNGRVGRLHGRCCQCGKKYGEEKNHSNTELSMCRCTAPSCTTERRW